MAMISPSCWECGGKPDHKHVDLSHLKDLVSPTEERIDLAELDKPVAQFTHEDMALVYYLSGSASLFNVQTRDRLRDLADRIAKTL